MSFEINPGAKLAPSTADSPSEGSWLVAIDLDGTTIDEAGRASPAVVAELQRVQQSGHHLLVATGRSSATTLPVLKQVEVSPEYLVCSNGAVILQRDPASEEGYSRIRATGFDPSSVLHAIRRYIPEVHLAVEDERGAYRFTHPFSSATTESEEFQNVVPFETILTGRAVRVVAVAPGWDVAEFRAIVQRMRLVGVTFTLGWTAWLDIAAKGITKAVAAEEVRAVLGFGRDRVLAIGDGFNDIELLEWAGEQGRGVAMGHAPEALLAVATETTDGIASLFRPFVEAVVHDLASDSIAWIANPFSPRTVGDPSDLNEIELAGDAATIGPYEKINFDGRRIKTISIVIRNQSSRAIGMLCLNADVTEFDSVRRMLQGFLETVEPITETEALFRDDWHEKINRFIASWVAEQMTTIERLDRAGRRALIEALYRAGGFEGRRAPSYIAAVLGVSRATVYNELTRLRTVPAQLGTPSSQE